MKHGLLYVLANTVQHKDWDGRISAQNKEWAKTLRFARKQRPFHCSKAHTGWWTFSLTQTRKELDAEKTQPDIVPKSPEELAPSDSSQPEAPKHRLTADERTVRDAVMDKLKEQIAVSNDGINATYKASPQSQRTLAEHKVRIVRDTVSSERRAAFSYQRRYAARNSGCYRELLPPLEYVKLVRRAKGRKALNQRATSRCKIFRREEDPGHGEEARMELG